MELVREESQEQRETNPAFMTEQSHIQIDSISIDLSSTDLDEIHKDSEHFTIRGFVAEVRRKNGGLCFLFYSDRSDNSSDMPAYELPPMEIRKFKSSNCNSRADDSNSSPGTSKDSLGKSTPPQNKENQKSRRRYKGFEKLYIKAGWTDLIDGSWTSERPAKEAQILDGRSSPVISEVVREPLTSRSNNQSTQQKKSAKGKGVHADAFPQGGVLQENALAGFSNSRCAPSGKSVGEAVIVPFSGIECANATSSRKPDKDIRMHDGSYSQGMSKGIMVPPGGSSGKATSLKSFKEPKQRKAAPSQGMAVEFAMPPPGGYKSQKNSSKKGCPRPDIRAKLNKKRSYARRSVRQVESAGDRSDSQRGRSDGCETNSNRDSLPHNAAAMEADVLAPKRAASQSKINEEAVPCNPQLERNSSLSTAWRTQDSAVQNPQLDQSLKGRNVNVDEQGVKSKREPKYRSLSDMMVVNKPDNAGRNIDNLRALSGDLHDVERIGERSGKRKVSPVGPQDDSPGKDVSAKGCMPSSKAKPSSSMSRDASVSATLEKRSRCAQDGEQRPSGGEGQICNSEASPGVSPAAMTCIQEAEKQSNQPLNKADEEKRSTKKAKHQRRPECENICEKMDRFLQTAFGNGKKRNASPLNEEGQSASKFSQGGAAYDTSDCRAVFPTTGVEPHRNSQSWKLQVEASGPVEECKAGEGPSCVEKERNDESKGRMKDIDINSIPVEDKAPDQSSTDDIPMDIVELLAKNQQERRREASRDTLNLVGSTGDSNTQKHSGMLKPQASYGFSKQLEAMNPGKQKVSENYEAGRTNVLVGYPNKAHFSGNFSGYPQSKGHVPSGAQYSSSVGACLGIPYNNSMIRQPPQPSFGQYQGNSQIWHPTMQSRGPLGMHSRRPDMYHKSSVPFQINRVSTANQTSIPPQTWNSRIPEYANQSPTPPQNWDRNSRISGYSNGVNAQNPADFITPKGIRPVDLSSNETIPALQLLNFVQVASRSSTPPVNRNSELLRRIPFDPSGNQQRQYMPGPHFEPYKATASSSRPPPPPSHDTSSSAYQNELKTRWNFASQNQQSSYNTPVGNLCFDKSTTRVYSNDKKRQFPCVADKAMIPSSSSTNMKRQALDFASNRNEERALVPYKAEVCLTNRNPAEILDLGEARKYMIGPEDLSRGNDKGKAPKRRKTTPKPDNRLPMGGPVIKS